MKYIEVGMEQDKGYIKYFIYDKGGRSAKKVTCNLAKNEKTMLWLQVEKGKCPFKTVCVGNNRNISSFCENLKEYPIPSEAGTFFNSILCGAGGRRHFFNVLLLEAENCPINKQNCIGCEYLGNAITRPTPEKSHCHIVCNHPG